MATNPPVRPPDDVRVISGVLDVLADLLRRPVAAVIRLLDDLADVEVLYKHPTRAPKARQFLGWDAVRRLWRPMGGEIVADYFTSDEVTAATTYGLSEWMTPDGWDPTQPCEATATVVFDGNYTAQEVDPPTDPPTYIAAPMVLIKITDEDSGHVTIPGAGFEIGAASIDLGRDIGLKAVTITWQMLRGRPKVSAILPISAAQLAGISGSAPKLLVVTRVRPL